MTLFEAWSKKLKGEKNQMKYFSFLLIPILCLSTAALLVNAEELPFFIKTSETEKFYLTQGECREGFKETRALSKEFKVLVAGTRIKKCENQDPVIKKITTPQSSFVELFESKSFYFTQGECDKGFYSKGFRASEVSPHLTYDEHGILNDYERKILFEAGIKKCENRDNNTAIRIYVPLYDKKPFLWKR